MKVDKRKAIRLVACLNDFEGGGLNKWRDSFYELWRYQMVWNFAYHIEVASSRKSGVYVCIDVRQGYKQNALELMNELGYRRIKDTPINVGVCVDCDIDLDAMYYD